MPTSSLTGLPIGGQPTSSITGRPIGSLQGGATQGGQGAFGTVPQIPDPNDTAAAAISGNMGNMAGLYGLTNQLNTLIGNQARLPYELNLPNYTAMTGASSDNILSQLHGQVPTDVSNQLQQLGAERGISTGSIGSPNANTALMRALGLTSLGLQQQGEGNLTAAIGRTPTGKQFDPSSFLVNPADQQMAQFYANLFKAAPDPTAAGNAGIEKLLKGLGLGLGAGGGGRGGGGGGGFGADPLGFPQDNFMQGGWGPGEVSGGALGTPTAPAGTFSAPWSQGGPDLGQGDWTMWGGAAGTGTGDWLSGLGQNTNFGGGDYEGFFNDMG